MSTIQVEKVVNEPRNPTPANARAYRVAGQTSSTYTSSSASRNEPATLTANLVNGKAPAGAGKARLSA